MTERADTLHASRADVWYLKEIAFGSAETKRRLKIITQNFNGPCSFIAICNILILRGQIEVLPYERGTVSYEFLAQLVGEYLLMSCPDIDVSAALSIMPSTTKGLDLNPVFTGATSFRPAGEGGELKLFEQAGIELVHGWLVDPDSEEFRVLQHVRDYDTTVTLIADADHITRGRLLSGDVWGEGEAGSSSQAGSGPSGYAGPSSASDNYSEKDREKIEHALVAQAFLDSTKSQLTYHGLFQLASTLQPGSLVALFRNSHLSVLHKREGEDSSLYSLVTDHVFLQEPSVIWERLEDVDGVGSTFVDSAFVRSTPVGGDFAGHTAESALHALEMEGNPECKLYSVILARQLQAEEDARSHEIYKRRQQQQEIRQKEEERKRKNEDSASRKSKKMKDKCVIM
ncbi:uncharacterized protein BJ212DRAFT_1265931 [Suillus subaureus]|uniref:MINDY deubiquitinase domain-containing protein n=1 Tax=Suillus subaureus TaxID=48587 RepID=A0A9P7EGW7_9AGAM|nr:uncharacterized protein BJ212DRAFT_1265931 [Suillus subaureus]KAG1820861.1 hypothetical protein BJ212DRAFT_1265931 [Suillus subaureus]